MALRGLRLQLCLILPFCRGLYKGKGKVPKMLIHPPPHPYPQLAPQGRQVASHVVMVVLNTMVQSLLHQSALPAPCTALPAPLWSAYNHHHHHQSFGQRQLARVPHLPSHGTMTPPNTLILRSTLRKKLIKISRASNFAAVPQSPSMNATFFCRPSLSRLLLFRPRLFGLFVTKGCTDDNLHSAALLSVCYPT